MNMEVKEIGYLSREDILEAVAEALRQARRSYVKPFQLSSVVIVDNDNIEMEILDNGTLRKLVINIDELS